MEKYLCPSMMCADFGNLAREVRELDEAGADMFHVDIMDGGFVPSFAMSPQDLEVVRRNTKKPVDAHLMISNPGAYIEYFAKLGVDIIYIHPETDVHAPRTLAKIRDAGAAPGIAVNPGTAFETVRPLLGIVDYVLVMAVNPGFAGQKYLPFVDENIDALGGEKERRGFRMFIDGACSPERIRALAARGMDGFVLGTSALFGKGRAYGEIMPELRALTRS